ncbi:alpha-beta hydrolase superfamily lysophospholipase [Runella defluvii]|uniref:Alpha-beta hydrolase superfamily lysophospholipase n=1 Tax=Runella defluvii TaxID=370973 RepID=A0A7W5ZT38_9BACT|nr:alpha/beta fold hydrolase [Runella defluvii]MBB3841062.1 alpha-beta hydrolase superfamily lysophospholipase [Runella defluvii]
MKKKIKFKSFDGTNLVGILTIPNGKIKAAFLLVHGIPSDKDEWGFYKDLTFFLEENQIASFRFDFRYNGESQKGKFKNLTISALLNDIESAFWQLRNSFTEDLALYVVGTSCGGGILIKWLNSFKRPIKKAFLMAPVLDYMFEVAGKEKAHFVDKFSTLTDEDLIKIKKTGVLNEDVGYGIGMLNEANIFDIKDEFNNCHIPIHIFHGKDDTIVPIDITLRSISDYDNIKLTEIPKANHGFAVEGDDDLTHPDTKANHFFIYKKILKSI